MPKIGWTVLGDPGLIQQKHFGVLIGGHPTTVLRFSERGTATVRSLLAGEPITPETAEVANRLVARGMATLVSPPGSPVGTVQIVIPVHDDQDGLDRTLASLANSDSQILVVDDHSTSPTTVLHDRAGLIRNATSRGPGGARNRGVASSSGELICFVDAGVELGTYTIHRLAQHFDDPNLVAAAPRVRPRGLARSAVDRYEANHSPLDLGPRTASVEPNGRLSYLPTTCLMVRRSAFETVGGFDEGLRYGEDVDLIWRLLEVGRVDYRPDLVVTHPNRRGLVELARQRFGYGTAAGPLARRHPNNLAPLVVDRPTATFLISLCWPVSSIAAWVYQQGRLRRRLEPVVEQPLALAASLMTKGRLSALRSVSESSLRPYWPVSLLLMAFSRGPLTRWAATTAIAGLLSSSPRLAGAPLRLVDHVSYSCGVWWGAYQERSLRCLLPRFSKG